jgi:DNA primase
MLMEKGIYHCFRCGAVGKFDVSDALRERALQGDHSQAAQEVMGPPEGFYLLTEEPALSAKSLAGPRSYLRKRGITDQLQKDARIGVCIDGRFAGRVIIPVMGSEDTWLGYVGRVWAKSAWMPYLYPRGMLKGEIVYNHASLLVEEDKPVMIVEGVFDALALWPDAAAVLGKPSEPQIEAMLTAKRPVCVVLDGDAWEEAEMLALRLRFDGQRAGYVRLPPLTDPDEVPPDWLAEEARRSIEA